MRLGVLFYLCLSLLLGITACQNKETSKNQLGLKIWLSPDSSMLMVGGLPAEMIEELSASSLDTLFCKQFFRVYPETEDEEMQEIQKPVAGKYTLKSGVLGFKPNTPFIRGESYQAWIYAQDLELNMLELLEKNSWQNQIKPLKYKFRY